MSSPATSSPLLLGRRTRSRMLSTDGSSCFYLETVEAGLPTSEVKIGIQADALSWFDFMLDGDRVRLARTYLADNVLDHRVISYNVLCYV